MNNEKPRYQMEHQTHKELTGLLEDSLEFFCDEHMVSGELAWLITQCYATAKLEQMKGNIKWHKIGTMIQL